MQGEAAGHDIRFTFIVAYNLLQWTIRIDTGDVKRFRFDTAGSAQRGQAPSCILSDTVQASTSFLSDKFRFRNVAHKLDHGLGYGGGYRHASLQTRMLLRQWLQVC